MKKLLFVSILLISTQLFSQTKRDPRVVGLSGAYTTIAEGIFCVGYNPALVTEHMTNRLCYNYISQTADS